MKHFMTNGIFLSICACNTVGLRVVDGHMNATLDPDGVTCGNCRRTLAFKRKVGSVPTTARKESRHMTGLEWLDKEVKSGCAAVAIELLEKGKVGVYTGGTKDNPHAFTGTGDTAEEALNAAAAGK